MKRAVAFVNANRQTLPGDRRAWRSRTAVAEGAGRALGVCGDHAAAVRGFSACASTQEAHDARNARQLGGLRRRGTPDFGDCGGPPQHAHAVCNRKGSAAP